MNRWRFITNQLNKLNVKVLVISSDSDPKYNSAMRKLSRLGASKIAADSKINWFNCGLDDKNNCSRPFFIQDYIHVATKMRNFSLKTLTDPNRFPFGNKNLFISINHLQELIRKFSKDHHNLTEYTLNLNDRQNFDSVRRMTDKKVTDLLKLHIPGSEATAKFLELTRDIIDAFSDTHLSPLQRVKKIWYALFIIRIWRKFIDDSTDYSLKENFLSMNCFACIELNAHSLVLIIRYLNEIRKPELFLPFLYNSQSCENEFRKIRSFTTVYSTVANCSAKEILSRISKIHYMDEIAYSTERFHFPRHQAVQITSNLITLPTFAEVIEEINKCKKQAIDDAISFDLINRSNSANACKSIIKPLEIIQDRKESTKVQIFDDVRKKHFAEISKTSLKNYSEDFVGKIIEETSPFTKFVTTNGKIIVLKKTSLCWLLRPENHKLSSDRLLRVRANPKGIVKRKRIFLKSEKKKTGKLYRQRKIHEMFVKI